MPNVREMIKAFTATLPIYLGKGCDARNTVVHPVAPTTGVIEHFFQDQPWWYLEEGASERLLNDRAFKDTYCYSNPIPAQAREPMTADEYKGIEHVASKLGMRCQRDTQSE
jgi:hypothetical protein